MAHNSFTIDTNILIYHLNGEMKIQRQLQEWFSDGNLLFISAITRIELLAAQWIDETEEQKIQNLLNHFILLPVDGTIADLAEKVQRKYRPELGDGIIAATAIFTNSTLVTRNIRDFKKIAELSIKSL